MSEIRSAFTLSVNFRVWCRFRDNVKTKAFISVAISAFDPCRTIHAIVEHSGKVFCRISDIMFRTPCIIILFVSRTISLQR
jgi:hypothetical protein